MVRPARFFVICADRARTGKSLLARAVADWLTLEGEAPQLIDLDAPAFPLAERYPGRVEAADFGRTMGRVAVFDGIAQTPALTRVVDVPAAHEAAFLRDMQQLGLGEVLQEAGAEVVLFFLFTPTAASLNRALEVERMFPAARFQPVHNAALGEAAGNDEAESLYLELTRDGVVRLPVLSAPALAFIERVEFSFAALMRGEIAAPDLAVHNEARHFAQNLFKQLNRLQMAIDMDALKKMGFV
ncbi:MAG TPA: hypothetical protein ENK15_07480 [Thermopetrobacter sp.]|nr:hypothetical protein [Thermopetrobacter sp.]